MTIFFYCQHFLVFLTIIFSFFIIGSHKGSGIMDIDVLEASLDLYDYVKDECFRSKKTPDESGDSLYDKLKNLGNSVAFSCRIGDFLDFVADQYDLDSNCMVVTLLNGPEKETWGDNPIFYSKYDLVNNEHNYYEVSIKGYSDMPPHTLVHFPDGTIGNTMTTSVDSNFVRKKSDLFLSCSPVFEMRIGSFFDFSEIQADDRPLLEHCRLSCFSIDFGDTDCENFTHISTLKFESDPVDVYLHIPIRYLSNMREYDCSAFQLLMSYMESASEKESSMIKKRV